MLLEFRRILENSNAHQEKTNFKQLFIKVFPDFEEDFDQLLTEERFKEILTDYSICEAELAKLANLHEVEQLYQTVRSELELEIKNYIISNIKK